MIVRWSLRILWALFLTLVIVCGLGYWMATRTSLLEEQVNAWLDNILSSKWPVAVSIGDIGGEPWRLLRLTNVRVDEIRGDTLLPLLAIDTIEVEYLWRELAGKQWHVQRATLAGVRGTYTPPVQGTPFWKSAADTVRSQVLRLPQVRVDHLEFRRLSADWRARDTLSATVEQLNASLNIGEDRISAEAHVRGATLSAKNYLKLDTLDLRMVGFGREWFVDTLLAVFDSTRATGTAHVNFDSALWTRATVLLDPVRWNDLGRWIHADLPGGGRVSVELEYSGGSLAGRGTIHGELLSRRLDALGVTFRLNHGVVQFDTLFGRALGARVKGSGRLDASVRPIRYGLQARLQEFDLRNLVPGALPSNLNGYFNVSGRGASRADLRVDVVAESADGTLGAIDFSQATGALTVTSDSMYLHPDFRARYLGVDLNFGGALSFSEGMAVAGDLKSANVESLVARLGFPGMTSEAEGRFLLTDRTTDPTLTFDVRLDSLDYKIIHAQHARVMARLERAFQAPTGRVSGQVAPFTVGGLKLDSAEMAVDWSPEKLHFDSILVKRGEDSLLATANFDPKLRNLTIDTLGASVFQRPVRLPWPAEFTVGTDTLIVHNLTLMQDSGSLTTNGWVEYGGALNLTTAAADARIGPWLRLFYPHSTIDGKLFSELKLEGTTENPRLGFRMRLQDAEYKQFSLGDLTAEGEFSPDAMRFDTVLLQTGDGSWRASGVIPLVDSMGTWRIDRSGPLYGQMEVDGSGLRLATLVMPEVESLYGSAKGHLKVSGSLNDPRFSGQFVLSDADLKVWSLREHFSPSHFEVSLEDSIATIQEARLRVKGESHDVTLGGRLIFHGLTDLEYDLTAQGSNIPLSYEYADFNGRFDMNLWVRGRNIPLVSGRMVVREAYYGDPLEATDSLALVAEEFEPDTTSWNVNVDVEIPNNAWVKNEDVNAELSGNLRVIRERGVWNYLGTLEPVRGSYYLFGRKFRNLRGSIVFDDVHQVDPVLDLEADVNLPITDSSSGESAVTSYHEVTVKVQGRLSEPQIIPPSSLAETDFIRALYPLNDPQSAAEGASGLVTGYVERAVTRTGVETFEVRPSESGRYDWSDARLRIGTYLLPDVYIYGGSSVDPKKGQEVGFEYRLKNWLRLQGHRSYDNLYQFDLNFKWEADK